MYNFTKGTIFFLAIIILSASCRKKAFDEYYGRPDNLAAPIYQQLQAKKNFTSLLACIDKAGYKSILGAAGYWTLFAPNDKAFQTFFTGRGISGVAQLDSGTARQIVTYCLAYNAFNKMRLADYQSATGWVSSLAYKRRTAYYSGFYTDTNTINNQKLVALGSNRNNTNGVNFFILGDNNNKYIPYFIDNFLTAKGLSAADYNYFYPATTYTGFNVVDATVVNQDIVAENGFIHEIDKVLLPLPSIDKYLASNPQYSEFKKLFDKFMIQFVLNADATARYRLLTGLGDNVYIKSFNAALGFSLNNENYFKLQDNDAQTDGWTLFAPKNDVLDAYIDSTLLENYKAPGKTRDESLAQLPVQIIIDFLNAHMWQASVWPSKFSSTNNIQAEPARFDSRTDIIDKRILSNGLFYGTSKVQSANVFSTVYGKSYLDPKYLLMTRALDQNIRYNITVPSLPYTVFMMSDSLLRAKGFDYNTLRSEWQYTAPGTTAAASANAARDMLQRILATHVVPTPAGELDNLLSGSGETGIIETLNGEYIKYTASAVNAGTVVSGGTANNGATATSVRATSFKRAVNGRVYYCNDLLTYDTTTIGYSLYNLGRLTTSQFNYFFQFLANNTSLFTTAPTKTTEITGIGITPGVFYTVFVPNNAAIQAAVNAGLLPGTGTGPVKTPNFVFSTWSQNDKDLVASFIKYHIINKNTVVPDGKKNGSYETLYNPAGDAATVKIINNKNSMQVIDKNGSGKMVNVVIGSSNNLSNRCVIHLIDNYLQY